MTVLHQGYRIKCTSLCVVIIILTVLANNVDGHGRMLFPTQRSSLWRINKYSEQLKAVRYSANYDDNQIWCGGFERQWHENDGRCGVCGDPFDGARENEAGGKYGTGIISETFTESQVVGVDVELTVFHKGYFTFKICPNNNPRRVVTKECLDAYPLQMADGSGTRFYPDERAGGKGRYIVNVRLPVGMTCTQCVIQWLYNAGNNWGSDFETGEMCLGCGAQEQFVNCADVTIIPRNGQQPSNRQPTFVSTPTNPHPVVTPAVGRLMAMPKNPDMTQIAPEDREQSCNGVATGRFAGLPDFQSYCLTFCAKGICPKFYCACRPVESTSISQAVVIMTATATSRPRMPILTSVSYTETCTNPTPTAQFSRRYGIRSTTSYCVNYCRRHPSSCPNRVCTCRQKDSETGTTPSAQKPLNANVHCVGRPTSSFQAYNGYDLYCKERCTQQNCPKECFCDTTTTFVEKSNACTAYPINDFSKTDGAETWCRRFCTKSSCPYKTHCRLECS